MFILNCDQKSNSSHCVADRRPLCLVVMICDHKSNLPRSVARSSYYATFYRGSVRPNGIDVSKYTTTDKLKVMDRGHNPFQALMNNDTLRNVMCLKPAVKVT